MNPSVIRDIISGEPDVLTPAIKAEEELYKSARCPMCYEGGCRKMIRAPTVVMTEDGPHVVSSPFKGGLLPEGYAQCTNCNSEFNPRTGLIYNTEASMIHGSPEDPLLE